MDEIKFKQRNWRIGKSSVPISQKRRAGAVRGPLLMYISGPGIIM